MGFLAGLYTLLLVAICLLQALLLYRTGKPAARQDDEALKEWLRQQLEAQARVLEEKQAQQAQQNLAAMAHISDTLQTAVQGMSSTLTAGQNTQQQTMEQRLQGLETSNARFRVIFSSMGTSFATTSTCWYGMPITRPTSRMALRAAMVPKVTICATWSAPYLRFT